MASRSVLFAEPGLALQPEQPVEGQERGVANHGSAGLLASSAGRGWSGLAAELRSHSGVIAWRNPRADTETRIRLSSENCVPFSPSSRRKSSYMRETARVALRRMADKETDREQPEALSAK